MERYETNYQSRFQPKAPVLDPVQIGSPAEAMQQEFNRQNQGADLAQQQLSANNKMQIYIAEQRAEAEQQKIKNFQDLAQFSETVAGYITATGEHFAQKQMEEGQSIYYEHGVPPEMAAEYDEGEEFLRQSATAANELSSELEVSGAPAAAREVRNLTGYRALGYMQASLQDAAVSYAGYYEGAKETVKVNVNGREINYNQANTLAERNLLQAAIRQNFMSQYKDYNPAMLNKYLWPKMKETEAAQLIQWNKNQSDLLKKERNDDAVATLTSGIKSGNGGATVYEFLETHSRSFGGDKAAREKVKEIVDGLIDARAIGTDEIQSILGYRFKNRSGKVTTLGDQFNLEFGEFRQRLIAENAQAAGEREVIRKTKQDGYDAELKELFRGGKKPTEEEKKQILEWHDDNIGGEHSDYIKNLVTQEQEADDTMKEKLEQLRASRPGGYLMEGDLRGASPEIYNAYKQYITATPALMGQKRFVDLGHGMIKAQLRKMSPLTGDGKYTHPDAVKAEFYAIQEFNAAFAENLKTMDPDKAYAQAEALVMRRLTVEAGDTLEDLPILKRTTSTDKKNDIEIGVALQAVGQDTNIIKTGIIPGTLDSLNQLAEYAETGKGKIPDVYRAIAANSNGTLSTWDVAQLQLQASGKGSMLRIPDAEQAAQGLRPELKRLLTYRPTNGRTQRVAAVEGDNWKTFLDLVASVESKGYGDYDAMNIPYANTPYNSNDRLGRGLSTMTIGEVLQLQAADKVHAAGRYQFTNHQGTLAESMQAAGLTPDDPFSPENQDRLAVARARWRMEQDNGMSGLRREWIGLNYVPDAVLRPAMEGIVDDRSPFNQVSNLSTTVANAVYTTGNIGPTSTGPHLDVKRTDGSFFKYSDLDQFVDVQDRDKGRVPLSKVPQTGDWYSHTRRNSHGRDYGTYSGSKIYLKNGAKVVSSTPTVHGDYMVIRLPDGREFSFLHGKSN